MIDESGNLYIVDAIVALSIIFVVMLMVNTLISLPNPTYSDISHNSKDSQNIMEILSGKIDFEERFEKMQCHTAEHFVCGLVHSHYGFENVGFPYN